MRFLEFSDKWEKCNVGKLLEFYSTNSLSWEQLDYNGNGIRNLHYGLIHVGLPTLVDVAKVNLPYIKNGNVPKNYTLCRNGDVSFADASEDTKEVAKAVEFTNVSEIPIVSGLHTIHGRDILNRTVTGFKGYAFAAPSFHNQIRRIAQGTKIYSINSKNFNECYIGIPSKTEQAKVVSLLTLLDERITTQNKVIDKLQSLIVGLAQRLTQSGKALRIADCLECHSSTLQESSLSHCGDFPAYGATGIVGYTDICTSNNDAILIIKDGSGVGTVSMQKGGYAVLGTLNYLTQKQGFYLPYLYYVLMVFNFEPYKTGMAIPHIYFKDYCKAKITCPSYDEQVKIGDALSAIEAKLNVEKQLLASLTQQKSYLLREMFI